MKQFPGTIRASCVSSNVEDDRIVLEIHDVKSGVVLMKVSMTYAEYGVLAAGGRSTDCELTLFRTDLAGATRETKTEAVDINKYGYSHEKADAKKAVAPFEVDGWKARISDVFNGHRSFNKGDRRFSNVVFVRFVDSETGQPIPELPVTP